MLLTPSFPVLLLMQLSATTMDAVAVIIVLINVGLLVYMVLYTLKTIMHRARAQIREQVTYIEWEGNMARGTYHNQSYNNLPKAWPTR